MGENATKAIIIGASTFIAIITISAVLTYYNTAVEMVQSIGTGYDFDASYSQYVSEILLKTGSNATVNGTDVINLLNYFFEDPTVNVDIVNCIPLGETSGLKSYDDANLTLLSQFKKIRGNINPNASFKLEREIIRDYVLHITVTQLR